jgi:hypothetical protein
VCYCACPRAESSELAQQLMAAGLAKLSVLAEATRTRVPRSSRRAAARVSDLAHDAQGLWRGAENSLAVVPVNLNASVLQGCGHNLTLDSVWKDLVRIGASLK